MNTIRAEISDLFQNLTPGQKKIARFIHEHSDQVAFLSATQLAGKIGVSIATISRFIRMLGYPDYATFREALTDKAMADFSTSRRLADSARQMQVQHNGVLGTILSQDIENIQHLRDNTSSKPFEQAVFSLCRARRIYILGLRSTYALAYYLGFYLRFFLNNVVIIELGRWNFPEQITEANKQDVLVAISFKRYTRQTVELQRQIKSLGLTVIGISDSDLSPIASSSDISLVVPALLPTYFESFTAPMSLINALLAAVALQMQTEALPVLNRLESALDLFNIYY